jgi:2'-5' RNA ligase
LDDTYQSYLNRVARFTRAATQRTQLQTIQESPKFQGGDPVAFPGYSVMTAPWDEHPGNAALSQKLAALQQELVEQVDSGLIVPVKPESFHLTLVDLIWDDAYRQAIREKDNYEQQLRDRVAECFQACEATVTQHKPIHFDGLGLILRPRAIAVGLVPQEEDGYKRVLELRRSIYQNPRIMALGIEQQYNFTAHITLGYFGPIAPDLDRDRLCETLAAINDRWLDAEFPVLTAEAAQLWQFDNMSHFYREPSFPELSF